MNRNAIRANFAVPLLVVALVAPASAHAQSALVRVQCDDADKGAEVSIDGKFKGECPVDIGVPAGTVKLRVVKKVDASRERVFEQEFRVGADTVKRVEAVLSAPRISAEGQAQANRRALLERAEVAKRAQAREVDLSTGRIPPRPQVPLEVSEGIWKAIEESESYRNEHRPRGVNVAYQSKVQFEFTGSKFASVPRPAPKKWDSTSESVRLGEKCSVTLVFRTEDDKRDGGRRVYTCGVIYLGVTLDGKPEQVIKALDELNGSLFPIRVGNRMSIRYQMAHLPNREFDSSIATTCEVVSQGPAHELDKRMAGTAWKVHCRGSRTSNHDGKVQAQESTSYYIEDLGVMLSEIGAFDMSKKAFFLPTPGSQTVFVNRPDPEAGTIMTTTYVSYEWSVDK